MDLRSSAVKVQYAGTQQNPDPRKTEWANYVMGRNTQDLHFRD